MADAVPTAEELKRAIQEVRSGILDCVTAIEDIKLQQIPQIRNDYAIKIGCWEKELLEAEIAARRSKRRYALMQAQANEGEIKSSQNGQRRPMRQRLPTRKPSNGGWGG